MMKLSPAQIDDLATQTVDVGPVRLRQPNAAERQRLLEAENVVFRGLCRNIDSPDFRALALMLGEQPRWMIRARIYIWRRLCRACWIYRVRFEKQLTVFQLLQKWRGIRAALLNRLEN